MKNTHLMIPGPIEVDYSVLSQMSSPMVAHYDEEWVKFYNGVIEKLKVIIGTQQDVFIMVGSGHTGLEAAISSVTSEEDEILVGINGLFGHRIADIAQSYARKVNTVEIEWGKAIDPDLIDDALQSNREIKLVIVVQGETSTGVLSPIKEIAQVCKAHDVLLMVDAVCSIGAVPFEMDNWGVDLCVTASQKGIGAPPGLVIVSVSERAWEAARASGRDSKGWYLNLSKWKEFLSLPQPYFITMAINNVRAINASLDNIMEEGINERFSRHAKVARAFRAGIRNMGLSTLADESVALNSVSVVKMPSNVFSQDLIRFLRKQYNIMVADGLDTFKGKAIRVGHMDNSAYLYNIIPVLFGIETFLRNCCNMNISYGASLIGC